MIKGGFAQHYLGPGTPNLYFTDILNISRQGDSAIDLVALDAEFLQKVSVAFGIHNLPVRVGCPRHLEVVRQGEDVLPINDSMGNCAGVRFGTCEFRAGVHVLSEEAGRSQERKGSE